MDCENCRAAWKHSAGCTDHDPKIIGGNEGLGGPCPCAEELEGRPEDIC